MQQMNYRVITAEENETTLNVDHYNETFSIYTTAKRVASMLKKQFPSFYKEAEDKASATANDVPVSQITKVRLSSLK
jgi:hypothetical protein